MNDIQIMEMVVSGAHLPYVTPFLVKLHERSLSTYKHSIHVAALSVQLGAKLRLSEKRLLELAAGAIIHNIGKIKISESVLCKHGRLSDEDYTIIKMHPLYSYDMLVSSNVEHPYIAELICLLHHRKINGSGYPVDGDMPPSIDISRLPVEVQIVTVADMFAAMVSSRPYKEAYSGQYALQELYKDVSNDVLNYRCVSALEQLIDENDVFFQLGVDVWQDFEQKL